MTNKGGSKNGKMGGGEARRVFEEQISVLREG
jgi:hypothetical protein